MPATDVVILTASTGGGHDSVASALAEALHELAPECRVRILDALSGGRARGPLSPGRWYDLTVAHAPWLWGVFYRATDKPRVVRRGMIIVKVLLGPQLGTAIRAERPGIVVAVHPIAARLAAAVLCVTPSAPPLHCVVTDLVPLHRCWACADVDAFYVATPEARDALADMGIPRSRVSLTGLPVGGPFGRQIGISAEDGFPRVLLLGGGCPSRRFERIARALAASCPPVQLVVVCGRNARLRRRLARALDGRATVLGWCDDIAALMRWSSVVLTRGGPTTLAEALSQACPALIYQSLPGQEEGNGALAERLGIGHVLRDVDALVRVVASGSRTLPADDTTRAEWWGGAARRVAARLLAAAGG